MSVRTAAGAHIYCGLPQEEACSPFQVAVAPGPTIPSTSEAEGDASPAMDSLVEGVAGMTGYFNIQVTRRVCQPAGLLTYHGFNLRMTVNVSRSSYCVSSAVVLVDTAK